MLPTTRASFPFGVREAARMRIAQLNDCTVCLAFRADSVKSQGLTEEFYCHVGIHDDATSFTQQERLAMEYAERFATDHLSIDDGFVDRMRESFTDPEILDLTICLAVFLGLGAHPPCPRDHRDVTDRRLGVLPNQVVDTTDGWSSDGRVVPMMVVHVEPGVQGSGSGCL